MNCVAVASDLHSPACNFDGGVLVGVRALACTKKQRNKNWITTLAYMHNSCHAMNSMRNRTKPRNICWNSVNNNDNNSTIPKGPFERIWRRISSFSVQFIAIVVIVVVSIAVAAAANKSSCNFIVLSCIDDRKWIKEFEIVIEDARSAFAVCANGAYNIVRRLQCSA